MSPTNTALIPETSNVLKGRGCIMFSLRIPLNGRARLGLRCALALAAAPCIGLLSRPCSAQISIDAAYDDVKDVIEDLIRGEVGKNVAATIRKERAIGTRYFKPTLARLESSYWGTLNSTLRSDLIEFAVDYVYWQFASNTGEFPQGASFFRPEENTTGQSLYQSQCSIENRIDHAVPCSVAGAVKAQLEGDADLATVYLEELASDILLETYVISVDAAGRRDHRRRFNHWISDVSKFREQLDAIVAAFGLESVVLSTANIECAELLETLARDAPPVPAPEEVPEVAEATMVFRPDFSKFEVRRCLQNALQEESTKLPGVQVTVHVKGNRRTVSLSLKELAALARSESVGVRLQGLSGLAEKLVGTKLLEELVGDLQHAHRNEELAQCEMADKLQRELQKTKESESNIGHELEALKSEPEDAKAEAKKQYLEGEKKALANTVKELTSDWQEANKKCGDLKNLFDSFADRGIDYQGRLLPNTTLEIALPYRGGATASADSWESLKQLAAALVPPGGTSTFDKRVAEVVCGTCTLDNPVGAFERLRRLAQLLNMSEAEKRGYRSSFSASIELILAVMKGDSEAGIGAAIKKVEPLLQSARRGNYRDLAAHLLDSAIPTPAGTKSSVVSAQEAYKAFFKQFAAYVLDAEATGGNDDRVLQTAFKQSARDALSALGENGIPSAGAGHMYWVSVSAARSWAVSADAPEKSGYNRASVDLVGFRYTVPSLSKREGFWGIGLSTLDGLRPFFELATRSDGKEYRNPGWVAVNLVSPRAILWFAVPELTKRVTVDGSLGLVPSVPKPCSQGSDRPCVEYSRPFSAGWSHLEFSIALTYLL